MSATSPIRARRLTADQPGRSSDVETGRREHLARRAVAVFVALAAAALLAPGSASADEADTRDEGNVVTRSVEQTLEAVRRQSVGTPNAGRLYAMVTTAMYDAVNGIDRARRHGRTHALVSPAGAPVNGHRDVAAAAAAHAALSALLRADQAPVADGALDRALKSEVDAAGGKDDPAVAAGRRWGRHVGSQVVALRATDGTQAAQMIAACSRFSDPTVCEPGEFHTSFDARFRNMAAFGIADPEPYLSMSPPALHGPQYAAAYDDVKTCGSNSALLDALCADPTTAAQRDEISNFWLAENGTVRETGTWMQAALAIADQQGTVASTSRTSRLFALVGTAIADAVKVSWEAKATHFTWRPTTAIRQADSDPNPATAKHEGWTSRVTPVGAIPTAALNTARARRPSRVRHRPRSKASTATKPSPSASRPTALRTASAPTKARSRPPVRPAGRESSKESTSSSQTKTGAAPAARSEPKSSTRSWDAWALPPRQAPADEPLSRALPRPSMRLLPTNGGAHRVRTARRNPPTAVNAARPPPPQARQSPVHPPPGPSPLA